MIKNFFLIFGILLLTSCVSTKDITYFQYDEIDQSSIDTNFKITFKPDDLLQITISALDLEAVRPFNLPAVAYTTTTNSVMGTPQQQSYLVDSNGEIDFPVIGKLKLSGLNREEAIDLLKSKLSPDYVKNPTINIIVSNFRVTISGDVKKPGSYRISNEKISILEAIGLAGDLNISARRDNILVIRELNGEKMFYRVNLLSKKLYSSPVFYLEQNDYMYIQHNNAKIQSASFNQNTGLFISIASVLISLMTLTR